MDTLFAFCSQLIDLGLIKLATTFDLMEFDFMHFTTSFVAHTGTAIQNLVPEWSIVVTCT